LASQAVRPLEAAQAKVVAMGLQAMNYLVAAMEQRLVARQDLMM
jgi:hypothetical protein